MIQWQGVNLQAEMQSDLPIEWQMKHDWWVSVPLQGLIPPLTFSIHSDAPPIDNYFTGAEFDLYSERFISIINQTGVRYETFPVSIIDQKTEKIIEHSYKLFHLLEIDLAVDGEKSIIVDAMLGGLQVQEINKLVLTDEFIKQGKALTRIKEFRHLTVIRQEESSIGLYY
jgi:hypothetical protein